MPDASDEAFIWCRGLRFADDRRLLPPKCRRNLRAGSYEQTEYRAVSRIATPGDTVLEVGAGLGFLSSVLSARIGVKAVTAVEANPELIPYIRRTHALNGVKNVRILNAALGPASVARVAFHIRRNILASSLDPGAGARSGTTRTVRALDVGAVMDDVRPSLLVCDIEGGEADLIALMRLDGLRAAIVELHPRRIGPEGVRDIFAAMHASGLIYCADASFGRVVGFVRDRTPGPVTGGPESPPSRKALAPPPAIV